MSGAGQAFSENSEKRGKEKHAFVSD